jgi:hypothetical protein
VRAQRGRRADPAEQRAHRAVPQHVHVIDRIRARRHARDQARDLQVRVDTALAARPDVLRDQIAEPGAPGEGHHRDHAGMRHEIRVVEGGVRLREAMQQSHLQGVLWNWKLRQLPFSQVRGHLSRCHARKHHHLTGGSRLNAYQESYVRQRERYTGIFAESTRTLADARVAMLC